MTIRLPRVMHVRQIFCLVAPNSIKYSSVTNNVPRGYIPVYVGEEQKKQYVVLISYLNEPSFQKLPRQRKNLDMIIQWEAAQFPAETTCLLISLPVYQRIEINAHSSSCSN
ncbi:unnamed protein product [Citrullus colocynthis]|uniref:Uncharacterized protein n=1 Tax=Citrullus colocynthis TaxID=252529 RepID=A0ABP0Y9Z4_9ROSI